MVQGQPRQTGSETPSQQTAGYMVQACPPKLHMKIRWGTHASKSTSQKCLWDPCLNGTKTMCGGIACHSSYQEA
jgi:hypothetical protein